MTLKHPTLLGHLKPTRALVRLARQGDPMDFTSGVPMSTLPAQLFDLARQAGYAPSDNTALALHGRGSVMPHTDHIYGDAAVIWLVADTDKSALMVAHGGPNGVLYMKPGDLCVFPSMQHHAWVSRSSWAMFVLDVSAKRRLQHPDYRL